MKSLEGLKYLQGPCYLEDSPQHHYSEMVRNVESIKNLNGPIFEIDRKHCFQELIKHTEKIEKLMGPVFDVEHKHNCTEIITNAEVLKEMHHPILNCDCFLKKENILCEQVLPNTLILHKKTIWVPISPILGSYTLV